MSRQLSDHRGSGTGLGLSQAIGFARRSGGDIRVSSGIGIGTSFTLYLPRSHRFQTATPIAVAAAHPIAGGRRVLVVEDNEDVGDIAVQALHELGFETLFASSAERALAELALNTGCFDIVLSDVLMPGMSGIELAKEITRLYPGMPVILTSSYSDAFAQGGTQGFRLLRKPYSIHDLALKLAKVLGGPSEFIMIEQTAPRAGSTD